MRLSEIQLNELREYLETFEYGAWIDTNYTGHEMDWPVQVYGDMAVYHVEEAEHLSFINKRFSNIPIRTGPYEMGYQNGFIRLMFDNPTFGIDGKMEHIKKAWRLMRPSMMKMKTIYINDHPTGSYQFDEYVFDLPDDRAKLIQFMK